MLILRAHVWRFENFCVGAWTLIMHEGRSFRLHFPEILQPLIVYVFSMDADVRPGRWIGDAKSKKCTANDATTKKRTREATFTWTSSPGRVVYISDNLWPPFSTPLERLQRCTASCRSLKRFQVTWGVCNKLPGKSLRSCDAFVTADSNQIHAQSTEETPNMFSGLFFFTCDSVTTSNKATSKTSRW